MNRMQSAWRLARGLFSSRTGRATGCLYLLLSTVQVLVSLGWVDPSGHVDMRLWINGYILDLPQFNLWWVVSAVGGVAASWGLYGRAVASGPLVSRAVPGTAADAVVPETPPTGSTPEDRPPPVVLGVPAGAGLGQTFSREG